MPRKSNPRTELKRLNERQKQIANDIVEAEKRLYTGLGKVVCDAGADGLNEEDLLAILKAVVELGPQAAKAALLKSTPGASEQKKPPDEPAA
ncbi:MAG: DUF6437 family protein [Pseudomonadota bacterium]